MKSSLYDDKKTASELIQILRFTIENEEYGVELLKVQEVIRLSNITRLPKAPHFVKGVINLRGNVIPIIDLREKFGLNTLNYSTSTRAIIMEIQDQQIGIVVDFVNQVVQIPKDSIQPPPSVVSGLASEYIEGVSNSNEKLIIILKISEILSDDEILQLEKASEIVNNNVEE